MIKGKVGFSNILFSYKVPKKELTETCQKYSVTDFLLYISCKTTFFKNIIPKSTHVRF